MQSLYSLCLNTTIKFNIDYLKENLPKTIVSDIIERNIHYSIEQASLICMSSNLKKITGCSYDLFSSFNS